MGVAWLKRLASMVRVASMTRVWSGVDKESEGWTVSR